MNSYALAELRKQLTRDEIDLLKEIVTTLPTNAVIVNIGAGEGTSSMVFLETRKDIEVFTVDIAEINKSNGGLFSEREVLKKAGLYGGNFHQILGDSAIAGKTWEHGKVDMVFVDGSHWYTCVCADIEAWEPHIKNGGLLVFHDYYFSVHGGDSGRAIDKYFDKKDAIYRKDSIIAFRINKNEQ